jgi:hypothetical protein
MGDDDDDNELAGWPIVYDGKQLKWPALGPAAPVQQT